MGITFKKEKRQTGLAGVGSPNPDTVIKHAGQDVGLIVGPNWRTSDNKWIVRLMIEEGIDWKWITLKRRFSTEAEAREFIKGQQADLLKLKLHHHRE